MAVAWRGADSFGSEMGTPRAEYCGTWLQPVSARERESMMRQGTLATPRRISDPRCVERLGEHSPGSAQPTSRAARGVTWDIYGPAFEKVFGQRLPPYVGSMAAVRAQLGGIEPGLTDFNDVQIDRLAIILQKLHPPSKQGEKAQINRAAIRAAVAAERSLRAAYPPSAPPVPPSLVASYRSRRPFSVYDDLWRTRSTLTADGWQVQGAPSSPRGRQRAAPRDMSPPQSRSPQSPRSLEPGLLLRERELLQARMAAIDQVMAADSGQRPASTRRCFGRTAAGVQPLPFTASWPVRA